MDSDRTLMEIVQLPDGDYALQAVDEPGSPLVRIHLGEETRAFAGDDEVVIVKAMIAAAVKTVQGLRQKRDAQRSREQEERIVH